MDTHGTSTIWDRIDGWGHTDATDNGGDPNTVAKDGMFLDNPDALGDLAEAVGYLDEVQSRENVAFRAERMYTANDPRGEDSHGDDSFLIGGDYPEYMNDDFDYNDLAAWTPDWSVNPDRPSSTADPEFKSNAQLRNTEDDGVITTLLAGYRDLDASDFVGAEAELLEAQKANQIGRELARQGFIDRTSGWGHELDFDAQTFESLTRSDTMAMVDPPVTFEALVDGIYGDPI